MESRNQGNGTGTRNFLKEFFTFYRYLLSDPDLAFLVDPDTDPDPIRIQGFDDQRLKDWRKKNTAENFLYRTR